MKIAAHIGIFVATLVGCALLLHGSPAHYLIASAAGLVGLMLLFAAWSRRRGPKTRFVAFLSFVGIFFTSVGLSCFPGSLAYRIQIQATQTKLAQVFSLMEEGRRASGAYPRNIDELVEKAGLPWLTRDTVIAVSRPDYYAVHFRDPNALIGDSFSYDSNGKAWEYLQR